MQSVFKILKKLMYYNELYVNNLQTFLVQSYVIGFPKAKNLTAENGRKQRFSLLRVRKNSNSSNVSKDSGRKYKSPVLDLIGEIGVRCWVIS